MKYHTKTKTEKRPAENFRVYLPHLNYLQFVYDMRTFTEWETVAQKTCFEILASCFANVSFLSVLLDLQTIEFVSYATDPMQFVQ